MLYFKNKAHEEVWGICTNRISNHFHGKANLILHQIKKYSVYWTWCFGTMLAVEEMNREKTAKIIIKFISILTLWWSMCSVVSSVVGRRYLLWPVHSLGKTLLAFALLHSVLQGQICLLLQVSLDFLLLWWKGHLFLVLVLGLIGLHRIIQLQLL